MSTDTTSMHPRSLLPARSSAGTGSEQGFVRGAKSHNGQNREFSMGKTNQIILLGLLSLILHACSITSYEVINKLNDIPQQKSNELCDVKFSISLTSSSIYFGKRGSRNVLADENTRLNLTNYYINATKEILGNNGCSATYVKNYEDADIQIEVARTINSGDTGLGLVIGLTFGLLPIIQTNEDQLTFNFYNAKTKKQYKYTVDGNFYFHLFLIPAYWIFERDEFRELKSYKESLTNFIHNCEGRCLPKILEEILPPPGKASLILMSPIPISGGGITVIVNVNDKPQPKILGKSYYVVYVDPGVVNISNIAIHSMFGIVNVYKSEIKFDIYEGNTLYFVIREPQYEQIKKGDLSYHWHRVSSGIAQNNMFRYKKIQNAIIP